MLQESFQFSGSYRVLEFSNCLCLDLPHSLAGNLENPAHFFKRIGIAVTDSVS